MWVEEKEVDEKYKIYEKLQFQDGKFVRYQNYLYIIFVFLVFLNMF